jgi:Mg-chelatase subunit ChlD
MKRNAWVLVAVVLAGCQQRVITVADDPPIDRSPDAGSVDASEPRPDADFQVRWADAAPQATSTGADAAAPNCGLETFELKPRPAELMLVLDRSGSMNAPAAPGAPTTKWADVTSALDEAMMKTNQVIEWGMKAFPTDQTQCYVADGVEVPGAPMNHASVWAQIMKSTPDGDGTPTTLAIQKAVAYLAAHPSANARYLVVATDGEPNCRAGGGRSGATDEAGAVMAVSDALKAGLKTFVIGVATGPGAEAVLSDMAQAGGAPRASNPPYYPVASRADLISALGEITSIVTDCVFSLTKAPPSPDDVVVSVGGAPVMRDATHADGWDYGASNASIQLYGPACEQVKKGASKDVGIVFGCPPIN